MKNKKAQVGETVTWVIATVTIVVILMFFIFGASLLGSTKGILKYKNSVFSKSSYVGDNILLKKSVETYSYFVHADNSKSIRLYLEKQSNSSTNFDLSGFINRVEALK